RHDAIWRIDDERRLPERATGEVVAERADVAFTALHSLLDLLDASRKRFVAEIEVVAELLRPLARDAGGVVTAPDTLEIGIAPRSLRHGVRNRRATVVGGDHKRRRALALTDRKSTRLNSSHANISY